MRASHRLLAATLCASTWLGASAGSAAAQVPTTTTTTTTTFTTPAAPQGAPAPCVEVPAAGSGEAALPPPPVVSVPAPNVVVPAPVAPYVVAPPPVASTPLSQPSVLLLPSDLVLAGKGTWVRQGNELLLSHGDAPRSRRSGMIAAGIVLLSAGYMPALITGGLATLFNGPTLTGSTLLVPVVGPFLSSLAALTNPQEMGLGKSAARDWATGWSLVDGAIQVTGLALLIAGGRARPAATPSFVERVQILPYSTQNGGGVVVSGRF